MSAVDFSDWAIPDLVITLGGKDYTVHPPSVEGAKSILALAVQSEILLHLASADDVPPAIQEALDTLAQAGTPRGVVSLGQDVYDELVADGHPPVTIDRVALYAVYFWARGRARADAVAHYLWDPKDQETEDDGEGESPKA